MTGRLAVVAMLIVVSVLASLPPGDAAHKRAGTGANAAYLDQSRTDMIAGCRDRGAPRSYCECVAGEVVERNGHSVARLRAMEAQVSRLRPGAAPPRELVEASRACVKQPAAPAS